MDLERALSLLALPREVGIHPETGQPITAGIGRYGPFVQHAGTYANLDSVDEVFTVGLNRAVTAIADKLAGGGRRRNAPQVLRALGDHPDLSGPVTVRDGKYGPYVNHGKINATLPRGNDPAAVTLSEAVALITAKSGAPPKKKKPAARKSKKKPAQEETG